jgi:hypothetical protein
MLVANAIIWQTVHMEGVPYISPLCVECSASCCATGCKQGLKEGAIIDLE